MKTETFNPRNPNFKKVSDLPPEHQEDFVDVEPSGFVDKEALDNLQRTMHDVFSYKNTLSVEELDKL